MYEALTENGFTRSDLVVNLGGGVTGDMGGFAAATYLRGIDFIQVPTTLLSQVDASTCVSISLVFLSALLTGLNVYDNIAKHAGAGTLVPITGFANAMASPALEFKTEGFILGIGAKLFSIAGPVIVYGLAASTLYGLIIYIFKLY